MCSSACARSKEVCADDGLAGFHDLELSRLVRAREVLEAADNAIHDLMGALNEPDESVCSECGVQLWGPTAGEGLEHYRARESGVGKENYTPDDGHAPRQAWRARDDADPPHRH